MFGYVPRDNDQCATLHLGEEFTVMSRRVETEFLQFNATLGSQGETGIIDEGYPGAALCPGYHRIRLFQKILDFGWFPVVARKS